MASTITDRTAQLGSSASPNAENATVSLKQPVRVATTANITLSGTQTIDGVAVVANDRVLVKDQSTQTQNGIYVVASGAWTRAKDCADAGDLVTGTEVRVNAGATNQGRWYCSSADPIVFGTSNITWANSTGVDSINGQAGDVVFEELQYAWESRAALALATIDSDVDALRTFGYTTPGDGGGAIYKRVGSEPAHTGKVQSADGAWWEIAETTVTPLMFGAVGDAATNDTTAVQNCINYVKAISEGPMIRIDLAGRTYALGSGLTVDTRDYYRIENGGFLAIAGSWTGSDFMITFSGGIGNGMSDVRLDAADRTGCVSVAGGQRSLFINVDMVHFKSTSYGVAVTSGSGSTFIGCQAHQWLDDDAERPSVSDRTATAWYLNQADIRLISSVGAWCQKPLVLGASAHHCQIVGCHFYNGSGSAADGAISDMIIVESLAGAYSNVISACYLDNGYIDLYSTDITITDCVWLYNSSVVTLTSHLRIYATAANHTFSSNFKYTNNSHPGTLAIVDLLDNGNSWAVTSSIETETSGIEIVSGDIGRVSRYKTYTSEISGTDYTLAINDAWSVVRMTPSGSPRTITIPPNSSVAFPIGTEITIYHNGSGANTTTVAQGSGVTLNKVGGAGSMTITNQFGLVRLKKIAANEWHGVLQE